MVVEAGAVEVCFNSNSTLFVTVLKIIKVFLVEHTSINNESTFCNQRERDVVFKRLRDFSRKFSYQLLQF